MLITDATEFKVDLKIFNNNEEITNEFFEEFIISKLNEPVIVTSAIECLMKLMRFITRTKEFSEIQVNPDDYVMVNNKRFDCISKETKEKIN